MTAMQSGLGLTRLRSISGFAPAVTFGGERREAARVCNGLGRFFSPDARSATSGAVDMRNAATEHHSYRGRETDHHGYFPSGQSRGGEGEPVAQIDQDHGHACGHHQTAARCQAVDRGGVRFIRTAFIRCWRLYCLTALYFKAMGLLSFQWYCIK